VFVGLRTPGPPLANGERSWNGTKPPPAEPLAVSPKFPIDWFSVPITVNEPLDDRLKFPIEEFRVAVTVVVPEAVKPNVPIVWLRVPVTVVVPVAVRPKSPIDAERVPVTVVTAEGILTAIPPNQNNPGFASETIPLRVQKTEAMLVGHHRVQVISARFSKDGPPLYLAGFRRSERTNL